MDILFIPGWLIIAIIAAIVLIVLLAKGYVNAKPNEVVVITGLRKQRHLRGKAGFMIPFVEQRSYLDIEQFSTDVRTSESVPTLDFINVRADAAVKLKIGTTDEMVERAAENFLNWNTEDISNSVQDVLEGNLREVIGQMELRKMVNDRQEFASKVQDNVAPDLAKMGLEVIAFTVQSFSDEGGVIDNLGIENVETIKKDALIAKAKAERERKEVEAEQDKLANDKRVAADLEIAQKQNELKLKQAALKQEADIAQAKADAAQGIEAEIQRREQERVAAEANIMKQEKEAEVKEREVKVREQELDANIRKQAEAEKYARQQAAAIERRHQNPLVKTKSNYLSSVNLRPFNLRSPSGVWPLLALRELPSDDVDDTARHRDGVVREAFEIAAQQGDVDGLLHRSRPVLAQQHSEVVAAQVIHLVIDLCHAQGGDGVAVLQRLVGQADHRQAHLRHA